MAIYGRTLKNIRIDCTEFYKIYFNRMCLYPRTDHFDFLGRYCPAEGTYLGNIQAAIDRHFYFQGRPLGISETALGYLDAIVALCRRHGVEPVLVGSPVHPAYYARIPPGFKSRFESERERLRGKGVRVLDFTGAAWADDFYMDGDHLNQKGAVRFTDLVIDFLGGSDGTGKKVPGGHFSSFKPGSSLILGFKSSSLQKDQMMERIHFEKIF